ncbi:hypothetical protein TNCV_728191 [Trichonephila clavipes]|nr:hypothetical protein TNCV_728191 [Trichonephila clavipes]
MHTVIPCVIVVCPSTTNARLDQWQGHLLTRMYWFSTENESGFIGEDHTPPVGYIPACRRLVLMILDSLCLSQPVVFELFPLIPWMSGRG